MDLSRQPAYPPSNAVLHWILYYLEYWIEDLRQHYNYHFTLRASQSLPMWESTPIPPVQTGPLSTDFQKVLEWLGSVGPNLIESPLIFD